MSYPVKLHVYDLSQGMARQLSMAFLGKQIDGIWHTGVEVYGTEYFFGGGICTGIPGQTPYGTPVETIELGMTSIPKETFEHFLHGISNRYTMATYNILSNNCNNFSDEVVRFLLGHGIPDHIVSLPSEVLDTPLGAMLRPMIESMQAQMAQSAMAGGLGSVPVPPQLDALRGLGGLGGLGAGGVPGLAGLTETLGGGRGPAQVGVDVSSLLPPAPPKHPHDALPISLLRYRQPVLFTQGSVPVIFKKLREFAGAAAAPLDALEPVLSHPSPTAVLPEGVFAALDALVASLPPARVFPALDVWRLLVLHPVASRHYAAQYATTVAPLLARMAAGELPPPALVTGLRVAVNLFSTAEGAAAVCTVAGCGPAFAALAYALAEVPAARMAAATLAFNMGCTLSRTGVGLPPEVQDDAMQAVVALAHAVSTHDPAADQETAFRLLMALGQYLLYNPVQVDLVRGLGVDLSRYRSSAEQRVRDCAAEVQAILSATV